jgi:hypothetical protein
MIVQFILPKYVLCLPQGAYSHCPKRLGQFGHYSYILQLGTIYITVNYCMCINFGRHLAAIGIIYKICKYFGTVYCNVPPAEPITNTRYAALCAVNCVTIGFSAASVVGRVWGGGGILWTICPLGRVTPAETTQNPLGLCFKNVVFSVLNVVFPALCPKKKEESLSQS